MNAFISKLFGKKNKEVLNVRVSRFSRRVIIDFMNSDRTNFKRSVFRSGNIQISRTGNSVSINSEDFNKEDFVFETEAAALKAFALIKKKLSFTWFRYVKIAIVLVVSLIVIDSMASAVFSDFVQSQAAVSYPNQGAISQAGNQVQSVSTEPYAFNPQIRVPEVPMPQLTCAPE